MKLAKIIYHSDSDISREIINTPFGPFYKTSSTSAPKEIKGTWMPFFGIHEKTQGSGKHIQRGRFDKFLYNVFEVRIPHWLVPKLMSLFRSVKSDAIPARFATLECLLISSVLGDGMWETDEGKKLKTLLKAEFPLFYESKPTFTISDTASCVLKTPEAVNAWLMAQAKVQTISELAAQFPKNIESLIQASKVLNISEQTPVLTIYFDAKKSPDKTDSAVIEKPATSDTHIETNPAKKRKLEPAK